MKNDASDVSGSDVVSRRNFIRAGGMAALAGAAGLPLLLEACGGSAAPPSAGAASTGSVAGSVSPTSAASAKPAGSASLGAPPASALPSYIPAKTPLKPDYHSDDPRFEDGFDNYPANPFKSWTKAPPGAGSTFNVFMLNYALPGTPRDQNPAWKEIEKQLNATMLINLVPMSDYKIKLATTLAGGDIPDSIHLYPGYSAAPNLPDFFKAKCADLTPFLGGDNVKDYPNLAAIPTYAWKNSISAIDGKLYLIPIQRYLPAAQAQGGFIFRNSELWDKVIGVGVEPKDAADFKKMMQQLTKPGSQWAWGNTPALRYGLAVFTRMFGAPNTWGLDNSGKLVKDYETDAFKAGVGYLRDMWASGLVWPDAVTATDSRTSFVAQKFALSLEAYGVGWADFWRRGLQQKPPIHFSLMKPFAAEAGQKPQAYLSGGFIAMNALKAGPPERIKELLRIFDWLAAPFGSQEDLLLTYGVKDLDYTLDATGNPVPTAKGPADAAYSPWKYLAQHPQVNYQADLPGYAKASFEAEQGIFPIGVEDPTMGYYSPAQFGTAAFTAEQKFTDGVNSIIVGRDPLTNYDQLVKDWQATAGNQIRKEYMDAMSAGK